MVAVGGSLGGMAALRTLVRGLPQGFRVPILAVLHMDPDKPSNAAALIGAHTGLEVRVAVAGERPRPGTIHLAPPDRHLVVRGGRLQLTRTPRVHYSRPSVDLLFASVAASYGPRALAVVLSGTGSDGSQGLQAIKAAGGTCIIQDPASAAQPGMPEAAHATGCVDAAMPATRLGAYLAQAAKGTRAEVTAAAWRAAEELLRRHCGVDFSGHRPETLRRRMASRVAATGSPSAARYVALLRRDPQELERLRSALLVKVSAFLRDPHLWAELERRCLVPLVQQHGGREIRMWSAGCAGGEEAYTLALLTLAAAKGSRVPLKVFGTDLDKPALTQARKGRYPPEALQGFPDPLVRRFFVADHGQRRVGPELRRHVVFGHHDIVRDAPLAGMDLVACRNVLIYLRPKERAEAVARLAGAVRPGGYLFLGKAEDAQLPTPGFVRAAAGLPLFRRSLDPPEEPVGFGVATAKPRRDVQHAPAATPVALALDATLAVTMWGPAAELAFGRPARDALGASFPTLLDGSGLDEDALRRALASRRRSRLPTATLERRGIRHVLSLEAVPLPGGAGLLLAGTARPEAATGVEDDPDPSRHALLASVQAQQALNEELQSRNEELETVNEELQSLNDEIQVQGDEARRANLFLEALLEAGPDVVVGCDRRGRVAYWGSPATRRFGLSAGQALGKDLLELVPKLDTAPLRKLLRPGAKWPKKRTARHATAGGLRVAVFPAVDQDGRLHGTLLRITAKP